MSLLVSSWPERGKLLLPRLAVRHEPGQSSRHLLWLRVSIRDDGIESLYRFWLGIRDDWGKGLLVGYMGRRRHRGLWLRGWRVGLFALRGHSLRG